MSKINEVIDSLNNENVEEIKQQLISEANALSKANSDLYKRAKKAEGFEYNRESKEWIKKEESKEEPKNNPKQSEAESSEPDYSKLAFLEGRKITHPDDQKLVMEEAQRLKLPLTDILGMEHIKTKLKNANDQRESEEGMPKGRGKSGGSKFKGDVDYWVDRKNADGTYETPEDQELAEKVISRRMKREEQKSKFSDILYT